ncbi:MAG: hypothetical protein ABI268_05435 [Rhodanobacter sp.]
MNQPQKKMPEAWRQNDRRAKVSAWDQIVQELNQATRMQWLALGILFGGGLGACIAILLGWKG